MKECTRFPRASHLNSGTGVPPDEQSWPRKLGAVARLPKLHLEIAERSDVTPYGGAVLVSEFFRRFKVAEEIDSRVSVLKLHLPYRESDHILAQMLNLYLGGTCLEDQANIQNDEALLKMLDACRLPDPTTAGDFLRRFDEQENPGSLRQLREAVNAIQEKVWKKLAKRKSKRAKKREWCVVDLDGHIKQLYGNQKEGADFSYKGTWSYHPLLVSMAGTGECLAVMNKPGNLRSSEGAAELIGEVLPRLGPHFKHVLVRADSDFDRSDLRKAVEAVGAHFAFVARELPNRKDLPQHLREDTWDIFISGAEKEKQARKLRSGYKSRRKKKNRRVKRAKERGYRQIQRCMEWLTEVPWFYEDSDKEYRLIIRRQLIDETLGQLHLPGTYRYFYVITNLPESWSKEEVVDATYQRCDQENLIEQMKSSLAIWRMPVAEFAGNSAWLEIGRLAWNLGKWIAQLSLAPEVVRWEWKRFRHAFVYIAAKVVKRSRQLWVEFSHSHRFVRSLTAAHAQLRT